MGFCGLPSGSGLLRASLLGFCAVAGCSQAPQRGAIDPRYGVAPSPQVVAEGEAAPRGGGVYMVGKAYQIAGETYYPSEKPYAAVGMASWYGAGFHGRKTANGEVFDRSSISAAHRTMPLPSYARVTNLRNARSIVVRVNDRGPFHGGRIMDVSQRAAEALDFDRVGTARVKVEYVGRASLAGSDDLKLLATLRENGRPAMLKATTPAMTAANEDAVGAASMRGTSLAEADVAGAANDDDDAAVAAPAVRVKTVMAVAQSAPLPPSRPFDLGAVVGAGAPIKAGGKNKRSIDALANSMRPNGRT
ncbi:MAG: septal ring lytic transglycosylase RlpA family protein [Methylocystis sp.]|nr:septal ring lytic transglycosylase RlpA family protein [Methylocystis sp.]MBI3275143.1 septal ring lytic transglycosylase RlpA family protein [Methylocystis sp.]